MKIGYDAKRAFFNTRGLGNYSRGLIRVMSSLNPDEEFHLYTPKSKKPIPVEMGKNCICHYPEGFIWEHMPAAWRSLGCLSSMKRDKIELFHGLSHELPIGIEKSGIRTVVTMHDVIFLKHPEWFPLFDRYMFKKKYVDSCKRADKVVAISEQTKNDIIEYIGIDEKKIEVVYQGCDPLYTQPVSEEKKKEVKEKYGLPHDFIVTVCAIEERKNHKCIIKAMKSMKNAIPYVIIGRESKYKQELEQLIKEEKLDGMVKFLHNVSTEDMPAILHQATMMAYPSFYEGFGIPIIEAQNCNLPILTSTGSCFSEVGGLGAIYINPEKSDEWAYMMDQLLDYEMLLNEMKNKGKENASRFSDTKISEDMMRVYRNL